MKTFFQSNTVRVCLAAILTAWGTYFAGQIDLQSAITATFLAVGGIFLRKGQGVPIVKAFLFAVLVTGLVACATDGVSKPATATTGVGQYGSLSGVQSGQTGITMGGDVHYEIHTGGAADMPDALKKQVLDGLAVFDSAIEKTTDPDVLMKLLDKKTVYMDKISRAFGVTIVMVGDSTGGAAGPDTGVPVEAEPEKPGAMTDAAKAAAEALIPGGTGG